MSRRKHYNPLPALNGRYVAGDPINLFAEDDVYPPSPTKPVDVLPLPAAESEVKPEDTPPPLQSESHGPPAVSPPTRAE